MIKANIITVNEKNAIELAKRMSVACHSNGERYVVPDRLNNIEEELEGSAYKRIKKGDIFRLYARKPLSEIKERILLVSSHADNLQPARDPVENGNIIHGIFDNAITNAACLYLMKYCDLPDNVVFAFTGDEEDDDETEVFLRKLGIRFEKDNKDIDKMGAYKTCEYLKREKKDFNALVLDVTESGYDEGADFTLENDFIYKSEKEWGKQLIKLAVSSEMAWKYIQTDKEQKEENPDDYYKSGKIRKKLEKKAPEALSYYDGDYEEADEDESYEYDLQDISCISLCLPCYVQKGKSMHDPDGFDIKKTGYFNYIAFLANACALPV